MMRTTVAHAALLWIHGPHPEVTRLAAQNMQCRLESDFYFYAPAIEPDDVQRCQPKIGARQKAAAAPRMISQDEALDLSKRAPDQIDAAIADRHIRLAVERTGRLHELARVIEQPVQNDFLAVLPGPTAMP